VGMNWKEPTGADTFDPTIVPKLTQLIGRGLLRAGRPGRTS
jgi:hypothetical protein